MPMRLPRVRVRLWWLMVAVAVVGVGLGLGFDRLVRQPAKDALRARIETHERGAVYWDDPGRSGVKAPLTAASRDAIRGLRDWHRGRARELGQLDPMRVPSGALNEDFSEDVQRTIVVLNQVNFDVGRSMSSSSAGEAESHAPPD